MENSSFDSLMVDDLHIFFPDRGITTTNLREKDLLQLCEAVKLLYLPVDQDFARQSTGVDLKGKCKDENFTNVCF